MLLAFHPHLIRPDCASGDLRFASMLAAMERENTVDLFMGGVRADISPERLSALRRHFHGELIHDQPFGNEVALCRRPYTCCLIEFWTFAELMLPSIRGYVPWAPVIIDSVDVHFVREEAAAKLGMMDAEEVEANKRREVAIYEKADAVMVVTEDDAFALKAAGVTKPVFVIPNILAGRDRPSIARERELLFIGGFSHAPNADGLLWFVRECWARIREEMPDAKLTVVGSNATEEVLALNKVPGVTVLGYVPETGPFLDRAAISISPLRYGGGMKGKVCEALAAGVPLVTTTTGAQGIDIKDRAGARVADSAEDLAAAVIWALANTDAAEAMGREGKRIIDAVCSPQVVSQRVQEMLKSFTKEPGAAEKLGWRLRVSQFNIKSFMRQAGVSSGLEKVKQLLRERKLDPRRA